MLVLYVKMHKPTVYVCICLYGQTERPLKTRIAEHRKAVSSFDHNSKVAAHVHQSNHNMDFENVKIVGLETNYHEGLFLEAWHSTEDPNARKNDHIKIPEAHKKLHERKSFKSDVSGHARASLALRFFVKSM